MLPIFYSNVAFIDKEKDKNRKVLRGKGHMAFCAKSHLCPALASEFITAASELPIVFLIDNDKATPIFMFGLKPGQNLFVSEAGEWTGAYLPRYLERFPFILANLEDGNTVLAVEAECLSDDKGEALFHENGDSAEALQSALKVAEQYSADATLSDAFLERLRKLDIMRPISVQIDLDGSVYGWSDLLVVDETKLAALSDKKLGDLVRTGDLALIHAHLFSLRSFQNLKLRIDQQPEAKA